MRANEFWNKHKSGKNVWEQSVAEGLTETRDSLFAFVKRHFPTWPDYVLKDFLYPQAKGIRDQAELDDFLKRNKQDYGNCKWTLIKLHITLDIFTPKTQREIARREGGSSNPNQVPRDAERHALQSQMIQQKGVSAEPIIVAKLANGYDLIEGWHRTIQNLKAFPQGYTGPAWVCTGATYKSEIVKQGVAEGLEVDVPNEDWLQDKIDYAKSKGRNSFGVPYMGSTTASVRGTPPRVRVMRLASLPGMRNEQMNVRKDDLKWLMDYMERTGKLPPKSSDPNDEYLPFIMVAYNGEAWVNEGNHRIMAAYRLNWPDMPVEIRYFDGGERVASGPMAPGKIGLGPVKEQQGVAEEVNPDVTSDEYFIEPTENVRIGDFVFNARTFTGALGDFNSKGLQIRAYDPKNLKSSIGSADFIVKKDKKGNTWLESDDTEVDDEYRGKGVATMMYAFAKSLGNDIKPSPYQSNAGGTMWKKWGSDAKHLGEQDVAENFADGKGPGRPGDSQRHGIRKGATMAELEKASHAKGRKGQLARWQLNMRRGHKK